MQCDLDNATIHYEEYGQGEHGLGRGQGRPIVFLHGWTMDRRLEIADYEPIFAARGGWRRIYPDLPGMGCSLAKRIHDQDDVLAALLAFIDCVLPGERFVLCGTSLGGYLARAIAAQRREQVAGLLLRVPAVIADTAKRTLPPFRPLVSEEALLAPFGAAERDAMGDVLVQSPAYLAAHRRKLCDLVQPAIAANAPVVAEIRGDPRRYGLSFDLAEAEKGFTRPTLIIAARQDITVGYRDAWDILESYPRATFAVIDRADHGWPLESSRLLAALVEDWLDRIELSEKGS